MGTRQRRHGTRTGAFTTAVANALSNRAKLAVVLLALLARSYPPECLIACLALGKLKSYGIGSFRDLSEHSRLGSPWVLQERASPHLHTLS